jgi:hypothetical protein
MPLRQKRDVSKKSDTEYNTTIRWNILILQQAPKQNKQNKEE